MKYVLEGVFEIQFLPESQTKFDELPRQSDPFIAVEPTAYFEAYKHVLTGMKQLNDFNFPFEEYIVRYRNKQKLIVLFYYYIYVYGQFVLGCLVIQRLDSYIMQLLKLKN